MMPGQAPMGQVELDPLQKLIALLHGFAFSSGLGNPSAAISAPYGMGGNANLGQPGFGGGGGNGGTGSTGGGGGTNGTGGGL